MTETLEFFITDHLGSVTAILNEDGSLLEKINYDTWGNSDSSNAMFCGKEKDASGLIYMNARYYDPMVGRFLTEDPHKEGNSWYSYCNNNPLNIIDPNGKDMYAMRQQGLGPYPSEIIELGRSSTPNRFKMPDVSSAPKSAKPSSVFIPQAFALSVQSVINAVRGGITVEPQDYLIHEKSQEDPERRVFYRGLGKEDYSEVKAIHSIRSWALRVADPHNEMNTNNIIHKKVMSSIEKTLSPAGLEKTEAWKNWMQFEELTNIIIAVELFSHGIISPSAILPK